jgi:hypothetical protein
VAWAFAAPIASARSASPWPSRRDLSPAVAAVTLRSRQVAREQVATYQEQEKAAVQERTLKVRMLSVRRHHGLRR